MEGRSGHTPTSESLASMDPEEPGEASHQQQGAEDWRGQGQGEVGTGRQGRTWGVQGAFSRERVWTEGEASMEDWCAD